MNRTGQEELALFPPVRLLVRVLGEISMNAKKKILVVEDNEINRMLLCEILKSEYEVLEAENGQEALAVLKKCNDEISLILLDIVMPVMDGHTFLSVIQKTPSYASVPVIVTTQSDSEEDEIAALSSGATEFITKPYRPQAILRRVASIIRLRETAAIINQFQFDSLTGLYSKEFFYRRVKETLEHNPEKEYDILCSDIENFKLVNDIFGVPAGDRLLCSIASIYAKLVGEKGICGRLHADQFACLLERRYDYADEFFVQADTELGKISNMRNTVMKWGVYAVEDRTLAVGQMCDRALLAARKIKGQYGKHYSRYDDDLRNQMLHEQAITDIMEQALAEGQFVIYLQPKYSISTDRLAGAEALVRWEHPQWGIQSPAAFIPLFEKNGFITKLDQYVWDKTCAVMQEWDEKGYPPIPISVNVSRADVYQVDLTEVLMKTVQTYGIPPSRLHLEITESAYTEDPEQIITTVRRLRKLGFIIEMDDFGSGYSSLNMLNQLPLDILKLDMKFIQSETAKPIDKGILGFIMGLARWMKLSVVAEGVETREQLERLREIGCDFVQGYFFARPMPCADFEALLKRLDTEVAEKGTPPDESLQGEASLGYILVAEEDEAYRRELQSLFGGRYQIAETATGQETLGFIIRFEREISAVVLSLTLPDMDGFSILEVLQREKNVWNIPVIVTGRPDIRMEEQAIDAGADDFAYKPYSSGTIERRLAHAMRRTMTYEREQALQEEAGRDYLTGLLNRRGLSEASRALRKEDAPLAVYLFDLDDLKQINDTYGHESGDRLIKKFGTLLCEHTRSSDILARFGGDEFIAVIRQMGADDTALRKGEDICRAFQEGELTERFATSCTGGVVIWDYDVPIANIIVEADKALYRAKRGMKGHCCLQKGCDI